ncbi:hypothetical protein [Klebsiella pneumoniae]
MRCLQYLATFDDFSCPIHAPSSNRAVVPPQIVNGECDDSINLYTVALDRLSFPGNERLPLQPTKIRHPTSNGRLLFFSGKSQKKCHSSRYVKRNFRKQIMDINPKENQEPQPTGSLSDPVEFNYHQ